MNSPDYKDPTTITVGADTLVIADDGEEWCLAADDPQIELRKNDWNEFDPAKCRPADFAALMRE
jgi:hypothetical protein